MKKITTIILSTACAFAAGSALADANTLTVVNNSESDSTMMINNKCTSDILGERGITRSHQSNSYIAPLVKLACGPSQPCSATLYASYDCTGDDIGTGEIDTTSLLIKQISSQPGHDVEGVGTSTITINN